MMQCKLASWNAYKVNRFPFRIGFIWKSIRESIRGRASFWMIQFLLPRGVKPLCSPTWLWMTNPICTPPCASNTQRSAKLKVWLSSPVLRHLNLIFCFVMTPRVSASTPDHLRSFLHIVSRFLSFPSVPLSSFSYQWQLRDYWTAPAVELVNW